MPQEPRSSRKAPKPFTADADLRRKRMWDAVHAMDAMIRKNRQAARAPGAAK